VQKIIDYFIKFICKPASKFSIDAPHFSNSNEAKSPANISGHFSVKESPNWAQIPLRASWQLRALFAIGTPDVSIERIWCRFSGSDLHDLIYEGIKLFFFKFRNHFAMFGASTSHWPSPWTSCFSIFACGQG
jgi:hypothetical protein